MASESTGTTTTEATRALAQRWVDAFNNHDVEAFRDLLAENYVEAGPSGTISGRDAALTDLVDAFTSQPDAAISVIALVADAGVAAVEYRMQATMAAPAHLPNGRVVPGTGRRYDMGGCSFLFVDGHQIAAVHHHYDRALMREQLGLPAGGAPIGTS